MSRNGNNHVSQHAWQQREDDVLDELQWIKGAMKELLQHSRTQSVTITSQSKAISHMQNTIDLLSTKITALEEQTTRISKETFTRFSDVDKRQKYHELMLKNQKWKYSISHPRTNYWDSIRHSDERRHCAECFLEHIQKEITKMRHGEGNGDVSLKNIGQSLPYNRAFYLHWEEFAKALTDHRYMLDCLHPSDETVFQLYDVDLPKSVLEILATALRCTHFKSFNLMNNNFGRNGIAFALDYMEHNEILEEFSLTQNAIHKREDVERLCQIVQVHPSINQIKLHGCVAGQINGYEMLCSIIRAGGAKLKYLSFCSNGVSTNGTQGCTFLSDFVASNPALETLLLEGNQFEDRDATVIAKALKRNTNLRFLTLQNNLLTRTGWVTLHRAKYDSSSLAAAAACNHTCEIEYDDRSNGLSQIDSTEYNPKAARAKKIYHVLSRRHRMGRGVEDRDVNGNLRYLEGVPLEFLPDMLIAIQRYSVYHLLDGGAIGTPDRDELDVDAVSIVYEIMRKW
eukprot:CAMPEP_0183734236 /NCGR_PEP_ID=MMETSP0737-20130205/43271_1 /TAXON_ID=385413 /ORGANISM="Thalassiosira miniscula, Strain CCMP1093" /LENGTH=511 /DNA_ID=CAMNT_0025967687 /DNA_START=126 /DNA_END=1658 /DNA_ORIENTATION=+